MASVKKLYKPLVICGPLCSGKTTLINYLRFTKPEYFKYVVPYTSKTDFRRDEI